jgi:N-acetylglucosaminyldiphosphoundecaprenol N-acetyl-beta-D-mannosaminyltransferase
MRDPESGSPPAGRVDILGVGVGAVDLDEAAETIESWIERREHRYVCVTGAHGIMESRRDPRLRDIHNAAGMVVPDGMPLVWVARLLGWKRTRRVYGPDLMRRMTEISARRGYRQFFYGGAPGVAEMLRAALVAANPDLKVCGLLCPPFRALTVEEDWAVVDTINAARPDIVWIGLSTPKQERWMADHLGRIEAPVMIGVGAAFDFLAGVKPQAPVWMQRNGLEWAYRLYTEPRRLWRRYACIVPGFGGLATALLFRHGVRAIAARLQRGAAAALVFRTRPPSSAA